LIEQGSAFKSPRRVIVQVLLHSRQTLRSKCRRLRQKLSDARRTLAQLTRQLEHLREENQRLQCQLRATQTHPVRQPAALPDDPPLPRHGYGPRLISLAVNLAQAVGFRGAQRALHIVFEWWGVSQNLPHWSAIRNWVQRLGVATLAEPLELADDWVWIADHSNQIGPEKALVVLAVRSSQLPPPGEALQHQHMRVLTVRPGTTWKRADVAAVYAELAAQHGVPRAVLCDGAVELRESVSALNSGKKRVLVLQDFKHKAANRLEARLGRDPRFAEFLAQVARTRSAVQQTELAPLAPPSLKQKARFMNLGTLLKWARMALWVLEHPQSSARRWATPERLEEKLGWLRLFAGELAVWQECQQVLERGVTFINRHGLFRGGCRRLRRILLRDLTSAVSQTLARELLQFVGQAQRRLKRAERLPLSTEILESCFAVYKQLERQHAKGGFTSLLAGFAALLTPATPAGIRRAFSRVSVRDVKQWVQVHLGQTLTSKRVATYREFSHATGSATKLATIG
jgi:hypothetical protein